MSPSKSTEHRAPEGDGDADLQACLPRKRAHAKAFASTDCILQLVSRDHLDRLTEYFHTHDIHKIIFPSSPCASSVKRVGAPAARRETGKSFLLMRDITPGAAEWVTWMAGSPVRFVVTRMFFLDGGEEGAKQTAQSLDELVGQLAAYGAAHGELGPVRLQFGPRSMERVLLDRFESMGDGCPFVFHPVQSSASLHVFQFEDGSFRWSMRSMDDHFFTSPDGPTRVPGSFTKAAAKLAEALFISGMGSVMETRGGTEGKTGKEGTEGKKANEGKGRVAVDVGASPGGWTHQLAVGQGMETVIAIDPAELHESVLALDNVHHVKKTSQTAEADVERILGPDRKISVLTCDANRPPTFIAQMLSPVVKYMDPGGLMVITMKFTVRRRRRQNDSAPPDDGVDSQLKESFKNLGYTLEDLRSVRLLSNTSFEKTILCRLATTS